MDDKTKMPKILLVRANSDGKHFYASLKEDVMERHKYEKQLNKNMDNKTLGCLEGLQAAALICQESAGDKNSHLSEKIMALHSKILLKSELNIDN